MDNQAQPQTPSARDEELTKLYDQLAEVVAAEKFPETDSGRLWNQIAMAEINKAIADITSDKYEKDHPGYVKRLADLQAYKNIYKRMQLAGSPVRKQKIQDAIGNEQQ